MEASMGEGMVQGVIPERVEGGISAAGGGRHRVGAEVGRRFT